MGGVVRAAAAFLLLASIGVALAAEPRKGPAPPITLDVNAGDYPWSSVGRFQRAGGGFCTGTLIGRRVVLTVAHCLFDKRSGTWQRPDALVFKLATFNRTGPSQSAARDYFTDPNYDPAKAPTIGSESYDWALIQLEEPIGDGAGYLGWVATDAKTFLAADPAKLPLFSVGYRQGTEAGLAVHVHCQVLDIPIEARMFLHSCGSTEAESGAPFFIFTGDTFRIIGVQAARVTSRVSGDVMGGAVSTVAFSDTTGSAQAHFGHTLSLEDWGRPEARVPAIRRHPIETVQRVLKRLGYDPGVADGVLHEETLRAIRAFEQSAGLPPDGVASIALVGHLLSAVK